MFKLQFFFLPKGFRGRPAWFVQVWWLVQVLFFRSSPQFAYRYRAFLLRLFGAKIGKGVLIRPSVSITYPWKVSIGDWSWVGDDVVLYSLGAISIGSNTVVSQKSYICAADHDYLTQDFRIRERPVQIGDSVWIATDVFVGPGVSVGDNAVVGARSSLFTDVPSGVLVVGNPFRIVRNLV